MKRLAFVLAAALFALTACTSAAETATAAEPATTPETTTEPTSKPAAAETGPLYTYSHRYAQDVVCLLYTSPSPRDRQKSRMPSSA